MQPFHCDIRPGVRLAGLSDGPLRPLRPTGLLWLGGFKSDMTGTKAETLALHAAREGRRSVRFDYSGHGASGGSFAEGTIGKWLEETIAIFEHHTAGPAGGGGIEHGRMAGAAARPPSRQVRR